MDGRYENVFTCRPFGPAAVKTVHTQTSRPRDRGYHLSLLLGCRAALSRKRVVSHRDPDDCRLAGYTHCALQSSARSPPRQARLLSLETTVFRIEVPQRPSRYCDGISRRSFLQLGIAGMATVSLAEVLRARDASRDLGHAQKVTSVILIWLDGGPSHMDLWDMKPEAPPEYRGLWRPIRTNVRGIEISEFFEKQAKIAGRFSIVRSLCNTGSGRTHHEPASRQMLTGRIDAVPNTRQAKYPSIGSIATRVCGSRRRGIPPYISIPVASTIGQIPGYLGASYLGRQHNPFQTGGDPNRTDFQIKNLAPPPSMTMRRLEDRQGLRKKFDQWHRTMDVSNAFEAMDRFDQEAFELISGSAARRAFDISLEDAGVRDRYGRNTWGQSTLLARRLVEAGSTFVTVHFGGWDNHIGLESSMKQKLPRVDAAVAALFEDLDVRGFRDQVLVVVAGEFGRTPRMNNGHGNGAPGRDHWGYAFSCILGGGGVRGGQIVGATDKRGEYVTGRKLTPDDLHATIYHVLGVDPGISFLDLSGRPIPAVADGTVIQELI